MSFSLSLKKLADKAGDNADLVAKKVIIDVLTSVVKKSPVDKGTFRGNWQVGFGSVNPTTTSADDKTGVAAISRAQAQLSQFNSGLTTYISNSLPYAHTLEYGEYGTGKYATEKTTRDGYSVQAPNGMVRMTLVEFKRKLGKALNTL